MDDTAIRNRSQPPSNWFLSLPPSQGPLTHEQLLQLCSHYDLNEDQLVEKEELAIMVQHFVEGTVRWVQHIIDMGMYLCMYVCMYV